MSNFNKNIREENAIVLDFLPNGYPLDDKPSHRKTSVVQALGKKHFILLELVPKKGIFLKSGQEIYVGQGKRDKIHHVLGRLSVKKLTQTAKSELNEVIKQIVEKHEQDFVDFFNNSQPLTMRMHSLELLPGLGKKHMWEIIEERRYEKFKSYEDIKKRVKLMPNPEKIIIKRIIKEILNTDLKHRIFAD